MAKSYTYVEVEKDLPLIVKASLQKQDDIHRQLFADEFGKKRKILPRAYLNSILAGHRWYLGNFWMTALQWALLPFAVGFLWWAIDLFQMRKLCDEKNAEIAKAILTEQRILVGN